MDARSQMAKAIALLLLLALLPGALAHLAGGEDQVIDGHIVDFGYDPAIPRAGKDLFMNFILVDEETHEPIAYDAVWVRIADDDIVFSGALAPKDGSAGMALRLDRGDYEVRMRFEREGTAVVETTASLRVRSWLGALLERIF